MGILGEGETAGVSTSAIVVGVAIDVGSAYGIEEVQKLAYKKLNIK